MKIMWLRDFYDHKNCGDTNPGDFVIGLPSQSLGNYVEVVLVKKRGKVETRLHPLFYVFEFVFIIRHSLIHDNGSEEVVFQTYNERITKRLMKLTEGTFYRLSTKLKQIRTKEGWDTFYAVNANRPEPEYENRISDA